MRHRRHIALIALAVAVLLLTGLFWLIEGGAPVPHKLYFEPGDGSIRPLFVLITRGQPHTNYLTTAAGLKVPQAGYVHRFYYASQNSIQPVSALRYWAGSCVAPVLRRLVNPDKFLGPRADDFAGTPAVLWLGYRATNSIFAEDAVLVSEQGLRLLLTPRVEDALTNSERLMSWEIPAPLTNHGRYRLIIPKSNRTLLTFIYQ